MPTFHGQRPSRPRSDFAAISIAVRIPAEIFPCPISRALFFSSSVRKTHAAVVLTVVGLPRGRVFVNIGISPI